MEFDSSSLEGALVLLGQRLLRSRQHYEVVAIGGGSLLLLGYIDRTTKDLDLLAIMDKGNLISANPIPEGLLKEITAVGTALNLGIHWVNGGPTSLLNSGLPEGFEERLVIKHYDALTIHFASRMDQICFKLYAAIDHGPTSKHFSDLLSLKPTHDELLTARQWCLTQDVSINFSDMLTQALNALGVKYDNS